jgi:hypothetical protein
MVIHPTLLPLLPHLLDISQINGQPRANPAFDTSRPDWASRVVGGATFDGSSAHAFEWVPVLNPTVEQDDEVGLAGTALKPDVSGADLPFTHPFGNDFEFTIVPDPSYNNLLASANRDPNNDTYRDSWSAARHSGIPIPTGVLGVEIEAPLVPDEYRVEHGDRVAVYGRWIVDAGHSDFRTEIHPPLLMARARSIDDRGNPTPPSVNATTLFQLWSRPYQAGQLFSTGGRTGLALQDYATAIAETLGDIQAFPPVFEQPFQGIHIVAFTVRPPVLVPQSTTALPTVQLQCSYHFTVNGSCAVQVIPSPVDLDSILVILALNSVSYPTLPEPARRFDSFSIQDLLAQVPGGVDLNILEELFLAWQGDVQVRRYAAPQTSQTQQSVGIVPFTPLKELPQFTHAIDGSQPFPIYGWLRLQWVNIEPRIAS